MSTLPTYQLLIEVTQPLRVTVGALGLCDFAAGRYLYTGSARRNMEARIARHTSWGENPQRPRHWHIDYLLSAPGVRVLEIRRLAPSECEINRCTAGRIPVPGFGASDCRAGCGSHLKYLGQ